MMNLLTVISEKLTVLAPQMLDVAAALTQAKTNAMSTFKPVVNNVVIPLACAGVLVIFIFNLVKCVQKHHGGDEFQSNIIGCIITAIIITVVATFPTWGWNMIG